MKGSRWVALMVGLLLLSAVFRLNALLLLDVLLVLVAGASRLWSANSLAGVSYRRRLDQNHAFFGEEIGLTVEIVNLKPLPLAWLRAEDDYPEEVELLTGRLHPHSIPRRWLLVNVLTLRWYERVRRHYRLRCGQRGLFVFGPARLVSGDLFGFARQEQSIDSTAEVVVYPKVVPLTRLGLPARRPFGELRPPRRLLEDPQRFQSIREYAPGDAFRDIDWKATARTRQLHTRVYEPSATRQLVLFLDVQTVPRAYQGIVPEYLELGMSAAASVATAALEMGYPVGLYANTTILRAPGRVRVPASRDSAQAAILLSALAQTAALAMNPIEETLDAETSGLPYGSTLVVISALQTEGLLTALLDLKAAGHAVTLLTVGDDRPEPELPGIQVCPLGGREEWRGLASLEVA